MSDQSKPTECVYNVGTALSGVDNAALDTKQLCPVAAKPGIADIMSDMHRRW